ncbi:MAG: hypothetical protein HYY86_00015 [Candidatus Harrisonbacteria bacterium]|nr:hypothetical protein [Candidatus Harrisonbacteria bacterium]
MSEEKNTPITPEEKKEEQLEIVVRNGALINLKSLATRFNIPQNDLKSVIAKALRLLNTVKDDKVIIEDKNGNGRFNLDIDKI